MNKEILQTKKELKKSLVIKYPKSEINGIWEERIQIEIHVDEEKNGQSPLIRLLLRLHFDR